MKRTKDPSIIMKFFDEAVATKARQKIIAVLFCGIGATIFSTGIVIGIIKPEHMEEPMEQEKTNNVKKIK